MARSGRIFGPGGPGTLLNGSGAGFCVRGADQRPEIVHGDQFHGFLGFRALYGVIFIARQGFLGCDRDFEEGLGCICALGTGQGPGPGPGPRTGLGQGPGTIGRTELLFNEMRSPVVCKDLPLEACCVAKFHNLKDSGQLLARA